MGIRITKPWEPLDAATVQRLPAQLGVYQLADDAERIRYIGYAGGRTLFGLRSALAAALAEPKGATQFRYEVNMQYLSRWHELLMLHQADHGSLPPGNETDRPRRLGRLSPA